MMTTLKAIEASLIKQGCEIDKGACLKAAMEIL